MDGALGADGRERRSYQNFRVTILKCPTIGRMTASAKPKKIKPEHTMFAVAYVDLPDTPKRPGLAYGRVYPKALPHNHQPAGLRLLQREDIRAEIERLEMAKLANAPITPEEVAREITMLAKADPRDLFEVRRGACRYCYGVGHQYQRTAREVREAMAAHIRKSQEDGDPDPHCLRFDHEGHDGFNPTKDPHPSCPECFGLGEVYEYLKDSRQWTPAAARLFAGVERTKEGLRVKTRSQDRALTLAATFHGLLRPTKDDPEDNVPPPSEIVYEGVDASAAARKGKP